MNLPAAESTILASIIESNGSTDLPPCLSGLLDNAPESFDDARLGQIAVAVRELKLDAKPVHPVAVAERLKFPDSTLFIMGLMQSAMSLDVAESEAEPIWEAFFTRKAKSVLSEGREAIERNPQHSEGVIDGVCYTLNDLKSQKKGSRPPAQKVLAKRLFNPLSVPPPLRTVYSLAGTTLSTPGNLSSITSSVKTGKTAATSAMLASSFPHSEDCDLLGFYSANPKNSAVIQIDSEQSPDDHWHVVNRMLRRVGLDKPPPWFYSYCLTGLGFKAALECFLEAIHIGFDRHGGIHSSLLDGITDLVSDVNDAAECNAFVSQMHGLTIQYDFPLIGVIHFNPGTEKTRGHLGSQFERKAETNLRLDKTNEVTTMWSDKQRRAPIPKGSGPSFCWSDDLQMHVSCDTTTNTRHQGAPSMVTRISSMNSHDFLAACPDQGEGRKEISRRLESWLATQNVDASFDTCRRAIISLVANGKLRKSDTGLYLKGPNA